MLEQNLHFIMNFWKNKNKFFIYFLLIIPLTECFMETIEDDYSIVHVYNAQTIQQETTPFPPKPQRSRRPENCSTDTTIIDKLLNGTGYNKFRIPGKFSLKNPNF